MSSVSNVLSLTDAMSPVLLGVMTNINTTIAAMERLNLASIAMQSSLSSISSVGLSTIISGASSASSVLSSAGNAANVLNSNINNINTSAFNIRIREFQSLETAILDAERIMRNLNMEMTNLGSTRVNNNQFKSMANVVEYLNSEVDSLQAELIQTGQYKVNDSSFAALRTTISGVNAQIDIMQQNILSTGSYRLSGGEFTSMIETIIRANAELLKMQGTIERVDHSMDHVGRNSGVVNNTKRWGQSLMEVYAKVQLIRMGFMAVSKAMQFADSYRTTNARLSLANDSSQTNKQLQGMIYDSANRTRTDYRTTGNMVSRVGLSGATAFDNAKEIVDFSELVSKSLKIGGAGTQETDATMLQLSQALGSGKLQGDEYRSLMENAPYMMNMIAQGMGVPKGELKQMSKDSDLTADAIVEALTKMSDNINEQFEGIPRTFGENMVLTKNIIGQWVSEMYEAGGTLDVLNLKFTGFVNWLESDSGSAFLSGLEVGLNVVLNIIFLVIDAAVWLGAAISDNWGWIEPVVWGLVGALTAYAAIIGTINTVQAIKNTLDLISATQTAINAGLTGAKASAHIAEATGCSAAAAAQWALNGALLANPLTWIVVIIVAAIALIIYALLNWQQQTATVVGYIGGAFGWLMAFIYNTFVMPLGNILSMLAEFMSNLFNDPISTVKQLFYNLCITVLDWISGLVGAIESLVNAIPGVEIHMSAKIDDFTDNLRKAKKDLEVEKGLETVNRFEKWNYDEAFGQGYDIGYDISLSASSGLQSLMDQFTGLGKVEEASLQDEHGTADYSGLTSALGDEKFKVTSDDKVDLSDESLKYLEEGVTQRFVNNVNLNAPAPNVNVQFTGAITKDVDMDQLAEITKKKIGIDIVEGAMISTNYNYSR